jgi:hypothetical protein
MFLGFPKHHIKKSTWSKLFLFIWVIGYWGHVSTFDILPLSLAQTIGLTAIAFSPFKKDLIFVLD